MTVGALLGGGGCVTCDGGGHALQDLDVEDGGRGSYADDLAGAGTLGGGGERGGPGAVAFLVLWGAVVAGAGVRGLVDFGEVEGEVGRYIGVGGVHAAVDDGDAHAFAHGDAPGAIGGAAGNVVAVAADLLDGPALGRGVEGIVGWGSRGEVGEDGAVGGEAAYGLRAADGALGGWGDGLGLETVGGEDAVVEDVVDVGLGGQAAEGVGFGLCGV